ncbi:MAG: phosphoethanolamine--lipid A transferase [Gammaproteobacteria bacterium]|nr:phosphoethanolamine--lipid A transferase [Gammaproteobacteria bacterium]
MNINISAKLPDISTDTLITFTSLFILAVHNQSFWTRLYKVVALPAAESIAFFISIFFLLFTILFILISLFSFKNTVKTVTSIFIIISALISYFSDSFGTIIDVNMIQNMIETDQHEATELINLDLLTHVILLGIVPAMLIYNINISKTPIKKLFINKAIFLSILCSLTSILIYNSLRNISYIFRENREISFLINPVFPIRSAVQYIRHQSGSDNKPLNKIFKDARKNITNESEHKNSIFVIVVGETARAKNFHINGYLRNTTPLLEKEHIYNFTNTVSCGTATAISVPCIFSHLTHNNYDDSMARNSENMLDAFTHAGINVLWRDNNSGCKGVCNRITSENMHHLKLDDYCTEEGCYDEVLLYKLQEYINKTDKDAVIVLHQQGSHGPAYFKQHPKSFAVFSPECDNSAVQNCTSEEIINAYDNTILYTDYFLSRLINLLKNNEKNFDTGMMYVSDHGESLGENGIYLHGLPYIIAPEEQTHVPFMLWLSSNFTENKSINTGCLNRKQNNHFSHDNLLHTALGIMDIRASIYQSDYDIFASCRANINPFHISSTL